MLREGQLTVGGRLEKCRRGGSGKNGGNSRGRGAIVLGGGRDFVESSVAQEVHWLATLIGRVDQLTDVQDESIDRLVSRVQSVIRRLW